MGQGQSASRVKPDDGAVTCVGGRSFGCQKLAPHQTKQKFYCWKCNADLGCRQCAQPEDELICLRCRDNGSEANWKKHGRMVRDLELGHEAFELIAKVYAGKIGERDAIASMQHAFAKFNR